MTCHDIQNALMQTPDPSAPTLDVAAHLTECAACQQFHERLVRIETNVLRLPVPASHGLAAFKRSLLQPSTETAAPTTVSHSEPTVFETTETAPSIVSVPARFIAQNLAGKRPSAGRRALLLSGIAAGLLVGIFGLYQVLHHPAQPIATNPQKDVTPSTPAEEAKQPVLLAQLLDCDVRLATSEPQKQRTEIMAELTGHLQDGIESQPDPATLQTLAVVYHGAVIDGLVPSAGLLDPEDRQATLAPVVQELARFHDQAGKLASNDPSVRKIVKTAADARRQLAALMPAVVKSAPESKPARKLKIDWKRDLPIIQAMVKAAQKLVLEQSPLKRARFAHELAENLGREIKLAARNRLGSWAVELGQYHQKLLSQGVAVSIGQARGQSVDRDELKAFAAQVAKSSQAIEADLQQIDGMQDVVQALASGRRQVEMNAASIDYEPSEK